MRRIKLFFKQLFTKKKADRSGDQSSEQKPTNPVRKVFLIILLVLAGFTVLKCGIAVVNYLVFSAEMKTYGKNLLDSDPLPADYVPETQAPYIPATEAVNYEASVPETDEALAVVEEETVPTVPQTVFDENGKTDSHDFEYEKFVIDYVVDGDTIVGFCKDSGTQYKVRMILVDTPESVASEEYQKSSGKTNTIYGQLASDYTKKHLKKGSTVYLTNDVVLCDKYERRLCYVWTELPTDIEDESEIRAKCFNARILSDGYGVVLKIDNSKYYELFCRLEQEAITDRRGLWADSGYRELMGLE